MLWLAMTPDTRGASALSATGNHNLTCLLSGTYLFEARPWILHSIRHKGLLLFQINLPIRIRDLCHLFPSLPFLGFSLLSFFHNLQKITGNTQTISMNPIAGAAGELGSEFGSTRPQRSGELNAIRTSLQTSRWPFPQLGYMSYSAVQHIRAAQRL